ncbi:Protein MRPS-7 [Aphelenchoides avenae]|nr:Protein MRPS-7 [Aphelenchus avenae]
MATTSKFVLQKASSLTQWRRLSITAATKSQYDVKAFTEATVELEKLDKPLAQDDPRNFMWIKAMKSDETPVFYRNRVVDKLVRVCLTEGKKETSRDNVLWALEAVKRRQYKAWRNAKTEEEKNAIELDPFVIANKALLNCRPLMKILPMVRGGSTYQVPYPMEEREAEFRAMKMLRDVCREKAKRGNNMLFREVLANEFLAAAKNEGLTVQAKQDLHNQLPKSEQATGVNEIRRMLAEVEDLLEQMELSVRELDSTGPDRSKYDLRVRSYRSDKKQLDNELTKAINRLKEGSSRDELLGFDEGISLDQQDQLIANTERLERTTRKIDDAYRITVETEQIGTEVLQNLGQQRETISRARERLREADADLSTSNKVVSVMIQRVIQNRMVLLVVAVVMMFSLLIVIYRAL